MIQCNIVIFSDYPHVCAGIYYNISRKKLKGDYNTMPYVNDPPLNELRSV